MTTHATPNVRLNHYNSNQQCLPNSNQASSAKANRLPLRTVFTCHDENNRRSTFGETAPDRVRCTFVVVFVFFFSMLCMCVFDLLIFRVPNNPKRFAIFKENLFLFFEKSFILTAFFLFTLFRLVTSFLLRHFNYFCC